MEVAATATGHAHARDASPLENGLDKVEHVLEGVFNTATILGVATGLVAPLELAPIAAQKLLGKTMKGESSEAVAHQAALGVHGVLAGLVGHGGLFERAAALRVPALVTPSRATSSPLLGKLLHGRHSLHSAAHAVFGVIGAVQAVRAIQEHGPAALIRTKRGRGGALQAIGGALSLMHHPAAQLGSAAAMGAALLNEFGVFGDDPEPEEEHAPAEAKPRSRLAAPGLGTRELLPEHQAATSSS